MAAYISFQPSDFFSTKLYSGNTSTNAITGVGFQPDATWLKDRDSSYNHAIQDAVRGVTKTIYPDDDAAQDTYANGQTSFDADGFTLGNQATVFNKSGDDYVSWNWKANGAGSANEDGSTNTTATSANATSKFSIGAYTGTGSAGMTVGHGLGVAPDLIVVKKTGGADRWCAYQSWNTAAPQTEALYWNYNYATTDDATFWNDVSPSSSVVTFGDKGDINAATTMVMYCWAKVRGYSHFGRYVGNNNAEGPMVYTGFRPAFVIIKRTDSTADWMMFDNQRLGYNVDNESLNVNLSGGEGSTDYLDILSNGFKIRTSDALVNANTGEYIYIAFAEFPIVSSNSKAGTAR